MEKLIAGDHQLDLEKFVSIPLIFKIADIKEVGKRQAPYSKTISLPGTENNNKFFGGLYDFNSGFEIFNPNIKTPAIFSISGDEFINGFLQLKSITKTDDGDINYNVVVYDGLIDFWTNLGKTTLQDLDFNSLNHFYNRTDIQASWAHSYRDGYFYPNLFNNETNVKTTDFKPGLFIRWLLDSIIENEGLTWGGNLKLDQTFNREIIQFETPATVPLNPITAQEKTFRASKTVDEQIASNNNSQMQFLPTDYQFTIDDETTPPNQDDNNLWDSVNRFEAPVIGNYKFSHSDIGVNVDVDYITNFTNTNLGSAFMRFQTKAVVRDGGGIFVREIPISQTFQELILPNTPLGLPSNISFTDVIPAATLIVPGGFNLFLMNGWTVDFFINISTWILNFTNNTISETRVSIDSGLHFESEFLLYNNTERTPLIFKDFVNTEFEKKKILLDIIARYNCFVYSDPEDPNNILFNIRDEFYRTAPIVDWTEKKDFNSKDKITLISELQTEELLLTYKKGEDSTNKAYTDAIGDDNIFGQFKFNFSNEFVKGEKKIESQFVPTPLVSHGGHSNLIVPSIHSREDLKGDRILYALGGIPGSWNWEYLDGTGTLQNETMTIYGYAGHYNIPSSPTLDINFGQLPFPNFYYNTPQVPTNNRFNKYWKNSINQIADGRLVESKFYLNASDVHFVKDNPNTKVFIDNTYFYVNEIKFEGNSSLRNLTSVALLTVEDEQEFGSLDPIVNIDIGDVKNVFVGAVALSEENIIVAQDITNDVNGSSNVVGNNVKNLRINGNNNFISENNNNIEINGNNNQVYGSNVVLIGVDNLVVRGDNIVVVNGVVTVGNVSSIFFHAVDGGRDELRDSNPTSTITKITSEFDGKFDLFNVSLWNVVDSIKGVTTLITDFFN